MTTCERESYCKGLCRAHYQRLWRTGSPEADGTVTYTRVRNGKTQTVTRRVRSRETGWSRHPLYKVWGGMRRRCHEPKAQNYRWYGGRGIYVTPEWREDFFLFRDWATAHGYEPGMELDRIDNDGPYSPENCRWATKISNLESRSGYLDEDLTLRLTSEATRQGVPTSTIVRNALEAFLPTVR